MGLGAASARQGRELGGVTRTVRGRELPRVTGGVTTSQIRMGRVPAETLTSVAPAISASSACRLAMGRGFDSDAHRGGAPGHQRGQHLSSMIQVSRAEKYGQPRDMPQVMGGEIVQADPGEPPT